MDPELKHLSLRECIFTPEEQGKVEEVLSILRPMKKATTFVSGEKQPSASKVLPTLAKLQTEMKEKVVDSALAVRMKHAVLQNLNLRYSDACVKNLLCKTTYIDPRYKEMTFASECEIFKAKQAIKEMGLSLADAVSNQQGTPSKAACGLPSLPAEVSIKVEADAPQYEDD